MSIRSALSFAPLFSSFASARPALDIVARQTTTTCASGVHVIAASGDGAANIGGYGLLGSLSNSIVGAIPGSDQVTLPYPKDDPSGLAKVTVGGQNMVQYITDYAASCPNTKIVLLGYSAGGIIALNALCGSSPPWTSPAGPLDPALLPNILGTVIYGEEAHAAASPFNAGSCTGNGRFPRTGASAACPASAATIRSYANAEDPQSCNGFVPDEHFAYPADYDQEATAFIVDLFNQNPSGPSSPSASSSVVSSTVIPSSVVTSTIAPSSVVVSTVDSSSVIVSTVAPSVVVSTVAPSVAVSTVVQSVPAQSSGLAQSSVPIPSRVAAPSSEATSAPPLQTYVTTALSATSAPAPVATSAAVQASSQAAFSQPPSSQAASSQAAFSQAASSQAASAPAATQPAYSASTSAPTGGSGNGSDGSASTPSPEVPQATITAPEPGTTSCPLDLDAAFEFPHLIIPVDESQPDLAPGTSYNGKVSNTVSSLFNFDVRSEYAGKQCSLIFTLPELAKLQYSSYTTSGTGGINIAQLESPADLQTSYANAPTEKTDLGTFAILPGGAHAFSTFPCPSGQRIGYKMSATGDYALDYFQASGEPIGLYIRVC